MSETEQATSWIPQSPLAPSLVYTASPPPSLMAPGVAIATKGWINYPVGKWHYVCLARVRSGRRCSKHSSPPRHPASPAIVPAILLPFPVFTVLQQGGASPQREHNLLETKGRRDEERRRKGDEGGEAPSLKAFLWCQSSTSSKTTIKHACKHMHLTGGLMSESGCDTAICASVLRVHCITPPQL